MFYILGQNRADLSCTSSSISKMTYWIQVLLVLYRAQQSGRAERQGRLCWQWFIMQTIIAERASERESSKIGRGISLTLWQNNDHHMMWSHYTSQTIKKNHQKEGDKKENIWMNNGQSFYKFYEKCKTQIQGTQQTLRGETWRKPY